MRFARLHEGLREDVANGRLPGAVALVAQRGQIVYHEAVGWLDGERRQPMTREAVFWIASMTKPITTVAALQLVEQGHLRLTDPVADYLPAMRHLHVAGRAERASPTVLDLMRHTAGFTYGFLGDTPVHQAYRQAGVYRFDQTNADMAVALGALPLVDAPGTVFEYGMSTDVLGRVVEVCCGQTLADRLRTALLAPLGMAHTGFEVADVDVSRVARPFASESFELAPPVQGGRWHSGGSGLWSTAADYLRFASLLLDPEVQPGAGLLSPASVHAMCRPQLPDGVRFGPYTQALGSVAPWPGTGHTFGLGLSIRLAASVQRPPGTVGDFCWPGMSGTLFWCDPVQDMVVVVMMQAPSQRQHYRDQVRRWVYADLAQQTGSKA